MAAGLPVVASDVKGIRELVGDTGILVSPPTPENFARELDNIVDNKELKTKLTKLGREKAKQYTWDNTISALEELYKKIAEKKVIDND